MQPDGKTLSSPVGSAIAFSAGGTIRYKMWACSNAVSAQTSPTDTAPAGCALLLNFLGQPTPTTSLPSTWLLSGGTLVPYTTSLGEHIVRAAYVTITAVDWHVWPASVTATSLANNVPPIVTSASVQPNGRSVVLFVSSQIPSGAGGPGSDFTLSVNGGVVPIDSISRPAVGMIQLILSTFVIGSTSTVTLAKVGTSFNYGTAPNFLANFSAISVTNNSTATVVNPSSAEVAPSAPSTPTPPSTPTVVAPVEPAPYSGPIFQGLAMNPLLSGSQAVLEGRKLDQIASVTIGGKAAKLSDATDKSLKLELPAGLAPGVYDLVVTTANHGKLTHMNAIRIREELPPTSLTIKGSGVLSGEEFKKLTAFARTQNPEMNTATCIVNSSSEGKSFMQARALCDRIAATNLNIKTTKFEVRSTVEGSAIFARVVFSSDQ